MLRNSVRVQKMESTGSQGFSSQAFWPIASDNIIILLYKISLANGQYRSYSVDRSDGAYCL